MKEIKFRIYFEADEDEPGWMSEPITLLDLLHGEGIEFRNKEDSVCLPLNDFRFFYMPNKNYKIMQYTGLKDKNGKEIYEGDMVKTYFNKKDAYSINTLNLKRSVNKIGKIEYIVDSFCIFIPKFGDNIYPLSFFGDEIIKQIEIIGNIYENPELLERN